MVGITSKLPHFSGLNNYCSQAISWCSKNQIVLSRTISFSILAGCGWLAGSFIWLPFTSQDAITPWQPQRSSVIASDLNTTDINRIQQRSVFGQVKKTERIISAPVIKDAPKTKLSLSLVGVVVADPESASLAIIANKKEQDTYGVNEKIDGTRATLMAVYEDRVVIENAGRSETLMLVDVPYTKAANSRRAVAKEKPAVVYDENRQAELDDLAAIRQEITEDPSQLFQYVRMSMLKRDGEIAGYRLSPGRSPELFDSVGLERGDIATAVNGIDLKEANAVTKLIPLMQDLTEVNLTVERDGEPYEIYIQL